MSRVQVPSLTPRGPSPLCRTAARGLVRVPPGHRALADITESVRELRYYRDTVFVPQPGPDSATAREIAARYANKQPGAASETAS